MPSSVRSLLLSTKSLAYLGSPTLEEYLDTPEASYNTLLRRRLEEVRLQPADQLYIAEYPDVVHFAALVTPDDPDTIAVLPVLARIVSASSRFDLRVIPDDSDLTLFDALVDDVDLVDQLDELDLPQVFVFDDEWNVQEQWGPRPKAADRRLDEWLAENPEYEALADSDDDVEQDEYFTLLDTLVHTMRHWYNSGLNQACIDEIRQLLTSLQRDDTGNGDESEA